MEETQNTAVCKPQETVAEGRDQAGRFTPGNKISKGNRWAGRSTQAKAALLRTIGAEELEALGRALYRQALDGDIQAARTVLMYCCGKPGESETLERVEALEARFGNNGDNDHGES